MGSATIRTAEYSNNYNVQYLGATSLRMTEKMSQLQCSDAAQYRCHFKYIYYQGGNTPIFGDRDSAENLTVTGKFNLCFVTCLHTLLLIWRTTALCKEQYYLQPWLWKTFSFAVRIYVRSSQNCVWTKPKLQGCFDFEFMLGFTARRQSKLFFAEKV